MANVGLKTKSITAGDPRLTAARKGWEDGRLQAPFDYAFVDRCKEEDGQNYEINRMSAIALRENGLPVPAWNSMSMVPTQVLCAKKLAMGFNRRDRDSGVGGYWPVKADRERAAGRV